MFLVKRRFSKCKNVADEVFVRDYLCAVACFAQCPKALAGFEPARSFDHRVLMYSKRSVGYVR